MVSHFKNGFWVMNPNATKAVEKVDEVRKLTKLMK